MTDDEILAVFSIGAYKFTERNQDTPISQAEKLGRLILINGIRAVIFEHDRRRLIRDRGESEANEIMGNPPWGRMGND